MTARVFEISLLPAQAQTLTVTLDGTDYNFTLTWNGFTECWMLDIYDFGGTLMVGKIPLVTGSDLLGQYAYLEFGGALIVQTDNDADAVPTYDNLGVNSHLYYVMPS